MKSLGTQLIVRKSDQISRLLTVEPPVTALQFHRSWLVRSARSLIDLAFALAMVILREFLPGNAVIADSSFFLAVYRDLTLARLQPYLC